MESEGDEAVTAPTPPPVIILCGGLGTRLREESELKPKPMVAIGGQPILWHIMKTYAAHGLKDFILCLGYKGHAIKDYFLNYRTYAADLTIDLSHPESIEYHTHPLEEDWRVTLVETGETTQTGARVGKAGRYVTADTFCVTYGDGVGNVDITALLAFHRAHGRIGTITGVRPPGRFGELRAGQDGSVVEFNEKPQVTEGVINGGFFVFRREFLTRYLSGREDEVLEQQPLQRLSQDGELMVRLHDGFWQPMDTYREFALLNEIWATGQAPWKVW
jgi:glucose-1-phosphate cytidylyltransferase